MKPYYLITFTLLLLASTAVRAQTNDELLNLLIRKKIVSVTEADSLRATIINKERLRRDTQKLFPLSLGRALNLSGLLQTRYQAFQNNSGTDGFDIRRARLDLKGALTNHWDYELYIEFAGAPQLLDAYTSYKFGDYLKFTVGQFKIPFSYESLVADSQLEFIDRSQVEESLNARAKDVLGNQVGRDVGAEISGSLFKLKNRYLFDYSFAVLNGNGIDRADNNQDKDIAGRFTVHPNANLGLSYDFYHGRDVFGASTVTQLRNRQGVDARFVYKRLSLTAEYDKGTDGAIKRDGWYAQSAYFILPQKLQLAVKYDTYDPNKQIDTDRSNWYIGGINYYFNNWTRLYVNYSYKHEETPIQTKNNLLAAEIQIQF